MEDLSTASTHSYLWAEQGNLLAHQWCLLLIWPFYPYPSESQGVSACKVTSVVSDSATPWIVSLPLSSVHGDGPGKHTGVSCHAFLQGIFWTQIKPVSPAAPALQEDSLTLSHQENPRKSIQFSCSAVSDSLWPHRLQHVCFSVVHYLLEFAQTHVHWVSDAIQSTHPLSSPSPPAFNLSQHQGLFQWVGCSHQVQKFWSFSFSISLSNEYSGLISLRIDWLDLLAVQGTLKSPLQHHSSKASILQHSVFFLVQLSHSYMTTGKTIALTIQTFQAPVPQGCDPWRGNLN